VINFATPIIPANLCLVLAANESDRRQLADRLAIAVDGRYPVQCKTPLGFISEEVLLFWPLILEQAVCPAQFPLRLRPETEQALATALWRKMNAKQETPRSLAAEYRLVRDSLDVMQLAGAAGLPLTEISTLLTNSWPDHQQQDCSPAERIETSSTLTFGTRATTTASSTLTQVTCNADKYSSVRNNNLANRPEQHYVHLFICSTLSAYRKSK
jgi:hypothetical protein